MAKKLVIIIFCLTIAVIGTYIKSFWGDFISSISLILPIFLIKTEKSNLELLSLNKPNKKAFSDWLYVVFPLFICFSFAWYFLSPLKTDFIIPNDSGPYFFNQLIGPALQEEIFFRAFIFYLFLEKKPEDLKGRFFNRANLLSALIFAISHFASFPHPARLFVFFPSLLFGFLFVGSGGLWAAVLCHALANLLSFILSHNLGTMPTWQIF